MLSCLLGSGVAATRLKDKLLPPLSQIENGSEGNRETTIKNSGGRTKRKYTAVTVPQQQANSEGQSSTPMRDYGKGRLTVDPVDSPWS